MTRDIAQPSMPTANATARDAAVRGESSDTRHAFLIMAHDQSDQLALLVDLLDDKRNDIFVQLDSTGSVKPEDVVVRNAGLVLLRPRRLHWGGYSLVEATVDLLREATKTHHDYYHLLSGADLPLVSQDELHRRLRGETRQFLSLQPHRDDWAGWMVRYYHPFVETTNYRGSVTARAASHFAVRTQRALRMDRLKGSGIQPRNASQWFSITHDCAAFVVENSDWIRFLCRRSLVGDEVFLPTLLMRSDAPAFEFAETDAEVAGNRRYIIWDEGQPNHPHLLRTADLAGIERASHSHLFARKFSRRDHPEIVDLVYSRLRDHGQLAIEWDRAANH